MCFLRHAWGLHLDLNPQAAGDNMDALLLTQATGDALEHVVA